MQAPSACNFYMQFYLGAFLCQGVDTMTKRKAVTKKTRFEIFKRDQFTCQYCGRSTPLVVLELDHIIPVSKDGGNEDENLITSCFDCNRGKSDNLLDQVIPPLLDKMPAMIEKEAQLKEYNKLLKSIKKRRKAGVKKVEAFIIEYFGLSFSDSFTPSVEEFIDKLGLEVVLDNMEKACLRLYQSSTCEHVLSYFCKMCWNQIKGVTGYGK